MSRSSLPLLITCEHASNFIPERWKNAFQGQEELLASHRGWDPGALELSATIQRATISPLIRGEVSRLLIELNRSEDHPQLFSEISALFDSREKRLIMERFYRPYRQSVQEAVGKLIRSHGCVLHLSVHSFAPVWQGRERELDVGVLFDPGRDPESIVARRFAGLLAADSSLRIRENEPYKGTDDGLTTYLRTCFPESSYMGLELEVSQRFPQGDASGWIRVMEAVAQVVKRLLAEKVL